MNQDINILKPEEIRQDLITFLKNKSLVPVVGAGFSCGANAYRGKVPTGIMYKEHMIQELSNNSEISEEEKEELLNEKFSTLCDYYEDDENVSQNCRLQYLKNNFYKVFMDKNDIRTHFFNIEWPYIYSLNIDDAIENVSEYKKIVLPNREVNEDIFNENKCLIKLHGDIDEIVTYRKGEKIFTSKEYALSIDKNAQLLNKLKNDYLNQNIIYIGCSLDDEMDLKTVSTFPFDYQVKDNLSKTIFFMKGNPTRLVKSKLKTYGITDVVCFETYDEMYTLLEEAWKEAIEIQKDELSEYSTMSILQIKGTDKKLNRDYYLWGQSLYDIKNHIIKYPYFFISRALTNEIIKNFKRNKIHLVYGARVSGRSYLLADLYRTIRDREVFYLDGRSRISKSALNELISKNNVTALFDTGTLSREQFEFLLKNARLINNNASNFVVIVNLNDSDMLGIVKWKLKQNIIKSSDIISYTIKNKLQDTEDAKEIKSINELLPVINLPPYNKDRTILDQLIYTESNLQIHGKFSEEHIKINSIKELALLIVLAIKEKIYSSDIINFAFDQEIVDALKKYTPFIERVESYDFEKAPADLSTIKYVLNSKYWLQRELGNYARIEKNYTDIGKAYRYIIRKVIEYSGNNEHTQRKKCRNYILFDVMNDVFLDKYHGNIKLIVYIYTQLHEFLAKDFHFLHQNAKCYLNYFYFMKDETERKQYLKEARELAIVAKEMAEDKYEKTKNDRLLITIAHMQYTIATIMCESCKSKDYSDMKEISNTIDTVYEAIISPYNSDDYQRERKQRSSRGILQFARYAVSNIEKFSISKDTSKKLDEIVNLMMLE